VSGVRPRNFANSGTVKTSRYIGWSASSVVTSLVAAVTSDADCFLELRGFALR
jgi:hypothetical protein